MEAKELRVGNWIEKDGKKYQATTMTIFCCGNNHKPILLTEEWLVKFRFHLADKGDKKRKCFHKEFQKDKIFEIWEENMSCRLWNGESDYKQHFDSLWLSPKYVHQLQNLYFTLTGEELELGL